MYALLKFLKFQLHVASSNCVERNEALFSKGRIKKQYLYFLQNYHIETISVLVKRGGGQALKMHD